MGGIIVETIVENDMCVSCKDNNVQALSKSLSK